MILPSSQYSHNNAPDMDQEMVTSVSLVKRHYRISLGLSNFTITSTAVLCPQSAIVYIVLYPNMALLDSSSYRRSSSLNHLTEREIQYPEHKARTARKLACRSITWLPLRSTVSQTWTRNKVVRSSTLESRVESTAVVAP